MSIIGISIVVVAMVVFTYVGSIFYYRRNEKEEHAPVEEIKPDKTEETIKHIVNVNLKLRSSTEDKEIISKVENLIDELIKIVILVNEAENYTTNTPLINRMGVKYLPSYVNTYLSLDSETQETRKSNFIDGLDTLNETIVKSRETIENEDKAEFTKQMGFVNAFFEKDYKGGI